MIPQTPRTSAGANPTLIETNETARPRTYREIARLVGKESALGTGDARNGSCFGALWMPSHCHHDRNPVQRITRTTSNDAMRMTSDHCAARNHPTGRP